MNVNQDELVHSNKRIFKCSLSSFATSARRHLTVYELHYYCDHQCHALFPYVQLTALEGDCLHQLHIFKVTERL